MFSLLTAASSFSQTRVEFRQKRGHQFEMCGPLQTELGKEMVCCAFEQIGV